MSHSDESKKLVKKFSDRSRHVTRQGNSFLIPHKFAPSGDVLTQENFDPRRDLSRLSLDDFRLLEALQEAKWDLPKACRKLELDETKAKARIKRLRYFEFEETKANALASIASPELVTSKNIENLYCDNLTDNQMESLKELGKITGAYKQAAISIQNNVFNLPSLTPEQEKELKLLADRIALSIPTEAQHAA